MGPLTPTPRPRVSLILTVPRPQRLKRIIPILGNLGIHKLILTGANDVPNDYFGEHCIVFYFFVLYCIALYGIDFRLFQPRVLTICFYFNDQAHNYYATSLYFRTA
jgi:hypothetical protein